MSDTLPNPEQCCTTCADQVSVLVPGPKGDPGTPGGDGTNGVSSTTTVNQGGGFVMPTTDSTVVVTVVSSLGFAVGQYVFVQNAGYLKVAAKTSATSLTLLNENYPGNAPAASVIANGSQIVPGGIKGLDGGVDFSTITTASFVMPDVNTTYATTTRARAANVATITTALNHNLTTGDYVLVSSLGGAGYNTSLVQVTVTGATTFTYANVGGNEGATADTAGRITPNIQIAVSTSLGFIAGQDVFIQDAGYFYLQSVPDTTHMIVQNNGTANNETSGTTIASGVRVSVSLNLNSLSPTVSKGQILVDDGSNAPNANLTAMSPGTDGQVLVSDSTQSNGRANATITPNTATDNGIARYDGASGTPVPLQDSKLLITDDGNIQSSGSGGNTRGQYATDLQTQRSVATQVASGLYSGVAAGTNNTASATYSFVGGGNTNSASGTSSAVCGGQSNSVSSGAPQGFIGGGISNSVTDDQSSIVGGDTNTISQVESFIGGGNGNSITAPNAVIGGGASNTASGQYAGVLAGLSNTASGTASTALGQSAVASLYGEVAHASGSTGVVGNSQIRYLVARNQTTNATPTVIFLNGSSSRLVIPNDTTWLFEAYVAARRTDADDESAGYLLQGVIDRNGSAATTALVGSVTKTVIAEDTAAWDVAATADTANGALSITVTGEAAKSITWVASVKIVNVTG